MIVSQTRFYLTGSKKINAALIGSNCFFFFRYSSGGERNLQSPVDVVSVSASLQWLFHPWKDWGCPFVWFRQVKSTLHGRGGPGWRVAQYTLRFLRFCYDVTVSPWTLTLTRTPKETADLVLCEGKTSNASAKLHQLLVKSSQQSTNDTQKEYKFLTVSVLPTRVYGSMVSANQC